MQAINVETTADRFLISIDKNLFTKEQLLRILNQFQLESLTQQLDFDESVNDFSDSIAQLNDEYIQERALRGSSEKFERALAKVRAVEPIEVDKL